MMPSYLQAGNTYYKKTTYLFAPLPFFSMGANYFSKITIQKK